MALRIFEPRYVRMVKEACASNSTGAPVLMESDGLRIGECQKVEPWECQISGDDILPMKEKLGEIFEMYPEIASLYEAPSFTDPIWVLNRWLELIPVDAHTKQEFLNQKDCRKVLNYLTELVSKLVIF